MKFKFKRMAPLTLSALVLYLMQGRCSIVVAVAAGTVVSVLALVFHFPSY